MKASRSVYLRRSGGQPTYRLGALGRLVAEFPNLFTVYEVNILASDGRRHRHALEIPVAVSAVSFSVGLALEEEDSRRVEAGDTDGIRCLAGNVQYAFSRFRTFPVPWPPRFIL